jgi:hypothetical protein
MTTATRTFFAISLAGFVGGSVVDFGGFEVNPMLTAILPVGAIFFGMFLISLILEKEIAKFDEEQAQRLALARQHLTVEKKPDKNL